MKWGIVSLAAAALAAPQAAAPMSAANRTEGVAPLAVFFDAVDAGRPAWASGVAQPDEGDTAVWQYAWDFGDPRSGAWPTSGRPRNEASGPVAAHVFEAPGVYTVRLSVAERGGRTRAYVQRIRVLPFAGPTHFVSSSAGDDRADGRTPATSWRTLERARRALETGGRVLLRRGDVFDLLGEPLRLAGKGPGHLGAYGKGGAPLVRVAGKDGGLVVHGDDWRITDLAFVGPGGEADQAGAVHFDVHRGIRHALLQRVRAQHFRVGLGWGDHEPMYGTPHDGCMIVESEVGDCEVNGIYAGGRRIALLGNTVRGIRTSHVARIWQAHKGVIAHNVLEDPGPERHALKLHGPAEGDGRPPTRHVVISDNRIRGRTWSVSIGPQNPGSDERVAHVLFERNRTSSHASVQVDLHLAARDVCVRNNVFEATGSAPGYAAVEVARRGIEPEPCDVRILHNTVIKEDAGEELSVCLAAGKAPGIEVLNNLAWAPKVERRRAVSGGAPVLAEGNLLPERPPFLDAGLKPLLPAARAGRPLARVRSDFRGAPRPRHGLCALGAFEP